MNGAADTAFLKRILAGLILATVFAGGISGAGLMRDPGTAEPLQLAEVPAQG